MRNKLNKVVLTGVLATALVAGTVIPAVPALAADTTTGTITITGAEKNKGTTEKGQTYKIYKLLSFEGTGNSGVYKLNGDKWDDFFKKGAGATYFDVSTDNYVSVKSQYISKDADGKVTISIPAETLAKDALKYAEDYKITPTKEITTNKDGQAEGSFAYGYYLMGTTTGSLASLNTTTPNAELVDKNNVPTVEKKVSDDGNYKASNDVQIGDTVSYQTTISAKKGAENYVYHDKMTDGLSFDKTSVKIEGLREGVDYTVASGDDLTDGDTFDVTFTKSYLDGITADTDIKITYSAVLNDQAKVAPSDADANTNTGKLTYGNGNHTEDTTTKTYTYKFNLHKYTGDVKSDALAGATFRLFKDNGERVAYDTSISASKNADANAAKEVKLEKVSDTVYRVVKDGNVGHGVDIVTVKGQDITIEGLDNQSYYMVETVAPEGMNLLNKYVDVKISRGGDADGTYSVTNSTRKADGNVAIVDVLNNGGSLLPSTGGIGTTIFKVVGGVLVVAAAIYFIIRRRKTV